MITFVIKIILGFLVLFSIIGVVRTYQIEHSSSQRLFATGKVDNLPEGLFAGTVLGNELPEDVSWKGKKFDAASKTGINIFENIKDGKIVQTQEYPFKVSVGPGLRDATLQVIKIDYSDSRNPFWLRPVLDEIVEVEPGVYLGKLQVRLIPGFPFSILYFSLKKSTQ